MSKRSDNTGMGKAKRYTGSFVIMVALCVSIVSFIVGTRGNELLAVVGPYFGVSVRTDSLDLSLVQETYRVLSSNFDGELDPRKMAQAASKGLVTAAGDPYTKYFTAKEAAEYDKSLSGNIGGGIGASLGKRDSAITVLKVLNDTPAEKSGLRAQDIIVGVNGKSTEDKTLGEVVHNIRGKIGTTVKLAVVRGDESKEFNIERAEIIAPDVQSKIKDNIGIITVSRFDKETGLKVRAAAEDFIKQGVEGVVLDLRSNGGGYLQAGVETAGVWLGGKLVVSERQDGKVVEKIHANSKPILGDMPTVVLINGGSASASEIVAGALNDHGVATLVGGQSFGKGSVQSLIELSNGDELKVTIARWYTPDGNNINEHGIKPDIEVKIDQEDVDASRDPQLEAAINKLKS